MHPTKIKAILNTMITPKPVTKKEEEEIEAASRAFLEVVCNKILTEPVPSGNGSILIRRRSKCPHKMGLDQFCCDQCPKFVAYLPTTTRVNWLCWCSKL